jgi:hypothetical protein
VIPDVFLLKKDAPTKQAYKHFKCPLKAYLKTIRNQQKLPENSVLEQFKFVGSSACLAQKTNKICFVVGDLLKFFESKRIKKVVI